MVVSIIVKSAYFIDQGDKNKRVVALTFMIFDNIKSAHNYNVSMKDHMY